MKWFVGLGNPGSKYVDTRHNVGFMALDRFAQEHGLAIAKKQGRAEIGEGIVNGHKVVLIKPLTYMNLSGEAVQAYMQYYKADPSDMIVLYDDLDTEMGRIRLRYQGSAGGHNGIKSIIQHVGSQQFNRIRMGISRPPAGHDIAHYVLSPFPKTQAELLDQMVSRTNEAMLHALEHSFEKTMAAFNG